MIDHHEEDKVTFLLEAVVELDWAQSTITQFTTAIPPSNFQQLDAALNSAWIRKQNEEDGKRRDQNQNSLDPKIPGVF